MLNSFRLLKISLIALIFALIVGVALANAESPIIPGGSAIFCPTCAGLIARTGQDMYKGGHIKFPKGAICPECKKQPQRGTYHWYSWPLWIKGHCGACHATGWKGAGE